MNLAEKTVALRKSKGFSQERLAEKSGISLRTIQRIEKSKAIPRLFTLQILADTFSVRLEELSAQENETVPEPARPGTEVFNTVQLINACGLLTMLLPVVPILVAFKIWKVNKNNLLISEAGKQIISFQVLWTVACILAMLLTPFINHIITGSYMVGKVSPLIFVYAAMVTLNLGCVLYYSFRLQKRSLEIYRIVPRLF